MKAKSQATKAKTKPFKFARRPGTGKAWAKIYDLANAAIPSDERLCFQQWDAGNVSCGTTVAAINLTSIEALRAFCRENKLPAPKAVVGGWKIAVLLDEAEILGLLARAMRDHLDRRSLIEASKALCNDAIPDDISDEWLAESIASRLSQFIVAHNDAAVTSPGRTSEFSCMTIEETLDDNDPKRIALERKRTKYVKRALREAAKYARSHA